MLYVKEKMPTWQRFCLQLSLAISIGSGIGAASEAIGVHNTTEAAVQLERNQAEHRQLAGQVATHNQLLLSSNAQALPRTTAPRPEELLGASSPSGNVADLRQEAQTHRDLGSLFTTAGLIALLTAGFCVPPVRRETLSDRLTREREDMLDRYGEATPAYNLSYFDDDPDTIIAVLPPAIPHTYIASSRAEHRQGGTAEGRAFHPIRGLQRWLSARRERIAQQTAPESCAYEAFRVPLNVIEPIQLESPVAGA